MPEKIDLGNGYTYTKTEWAPDRKLNPQYADVPDVPWVGIIIICPHGNRGHVQFNIPGHRIFQYGWDVESWEPLTISPSIQFLDPSCCHGFIREGKWVSA